MFHRTSYIYISYATFQIRSSLLLYFRISGYIKHMNPHGIQTTRTIETKMNSICGWFICGQFFLQNYVQFELKFYFIKVNWIWYERLLSGWFSVHVMNIQYTRESNVIDKNQTAMHSKWNEMFNVHRLTAVNIRVNWDDVPQWSFSYFILISVKRNKVILSSSSHSPFFLIHFIIIMYYHHRFVYYRFMHCLWRQTVNKCLAKMNIDAPTIFRTNMRRYHTVTKGLDTMHSNTTYNHIRMI